MQVSDPEMKAAYQLAEALVRLLVAVDEGASTRRAARLRNEPPVRIEQPPPPPAAQSGQTRSTGAPAQSIPDQILVTSREAARLLSISERSLWSISAPRGPIPVVRVGRAVRYSVEELSAISARLRTRRG